MRQLKGALAAVPFYRGVLKRKLKLAATIEFPPFSDRLQTDYRNSLIFGKKVVYLIIEKEKLF